MQLKGEQTFNSYRQEMLLELLTRNVYLFVNVVDNSLCSHVLQYKTILKK